jgi:hypothetical protein
LSRCDPVLVDDLARPDARDKALCDNLPLLLDRPSPATLTTRNHLDPLRRSHMTTLMTAPYRNIPLDRRLFAVHAEPSAHDTHSTQGGLSTPLTSHGISEPTFYAWKAKFGGMSISDAKRLRQLEHEPVERRQRPSGGVSLAKRLPLSGRQRRCGHPRCPSLNRCARLCWCRSCGARRLRCHFAGAAAGAGVGA